MNRRNKEKQAGFSLVEVVVSTATVSYTHLDVYKRQS